MFSLLLLGPSSRSQALIHHDLQCHPEQRDEPNSCSEKLQLQIPLEASGKETKTLSFKAGASFACYIHTVCHTRWKKLTQIFKFSL